MSASSLSGRVVVVTRPEHQAGSFSREIERRGGRSLEVATISIRTGQHREPLEHAIRSIADYDWVVFTSVNGVAAVRTVAAELGDDGRSFSSCKIAAIGPKTANAVAAWIRPPDIVPDEFVSDRIPALLGLSPGARVLLLRADIARKDIVTALESLGAAVDDVVAYEVNEDPSEISIRLVSELPVEFRPDVITFTSPSTVRGLRNVLRAAGRMSWLESAVLACVGPVTAKEVRTLVREPEVVAEQYTTEGLLDAIEKSGVLV